MHATSLTQLAHERLATRLGPGDWALDATLGNGHDMLFLARRVAPSGRVWGLDLQAEAIATTRARLAATGLDAVATLVQADHAWLADHLPAAALGRLRAVMFDLGGLAGGDQSIVTRPETTLPALTAALHLLDPAGLLSLLVRRDQPAGRREYVAILDWLGRSGARVERYDGQADCASSPLLFLLAPRV